MSEQFESFLKDNGIAFCTNEPMSRHTSFKIGGNADYFVRVTSAEALKKVLLGIKAFGMPFFILGKGTNILVSDTGIEGAVIDTCGMCDVKVNGNSITAGAGATLSSVCRVACENSLVGLEFAYGIPGSVGGGLYMNAGAYGGEMSQVVKSAEYVKANGESGTVVVEEMNLGYRKSVFAGSDMIITQVTFQLEKGDRKAIEDKMNELIGRRKEKQPLEYPSAGSTFKRPEGYFAGRLIEECGLKGASYGGAAVSEKHAGFVINRENATCNDVLNLIENVRGKVFDEKGVNLEPEVIFIGRKQQRN